MEQASEWSCLKVREAGCLSTCSWALLGEGCSWGHSLQGTSALFCGDAGLALPWDQRLPLGQDVGTGMGWLVMPSEAGTGCALIPTSPLPLRPPSAQCRPPSTSQTRHFTCPCILRCRHVMPAGLQGVF